MSSRGCLDNSHRAREFALFISISNFDTKQPGYFPNDILAKSNEFAKICHLGRKLSTLRRISANLVLSPNQESLSSRQRDPKANFCSPSGNSITETSVPTDDCHFSCSFAPCQANKLICNMPCLSRCPLERLHDTKRRITNETVTAISLKHEYSNSLVVGIYTPGGYY